MVTFNYDIADCIFFKQQIKINMRNNNGIQIYKNTETK